MRRKVVLQCQMGKERRRKDAEFRMRKKDKLRNYYTFHAFLDPVSHRNSSENGGRTAAAIMSCPGDICSLKAHDA